MIVISGITSGLGISLAKMLATKGFKVRGFSRNIQPVKQILNHPLIELVTADLTDFDSLRGACDGADRIVHLAALSSPWGKYADFFEINTEGTRRLLNLAKHLKVNRFIYVSTPSIYFDYRDKLQIKETDPLPKGYVNNYAKSKKLAEDCVDAAFLDGLACITIRPRAIFGPHDQALFPRILKACSSKGIPTFTNSSPLVDITYVDNVAHAICLALHADDSCLGQKYNITNDEPRSLWELFQNLMDQLCVPVKMRKIPYTIAYMTAFISEVSGLFTHKEPLITRYGVGVLAYSQTLSIEKAKKELNYHPLISIDEGIKRYAAWFQAQKDL